ncbi:hypothetical protein D3C80_1529960 [compost metagenome]
MDCAVSPFDQRFPVADDEVKVTLPPVQNVVAPEAEMVGVAGIELTVTSVSSDNAEVHVPEVTETE